MPHRQKGWPQRHRPRGRPRFLHLQERRPKRHRPRGRPKTPHPQEDGCRDTGRGGGLEFPALKNWDYCAIANALLQACVLHSTPSSPDYFSFVGLHRRKNDVFLLELGLGSNCPRRYIKTQRHEENAEEKQLNGALRTMTAQETGNGIKLVTS